MFFSRSKFWIASILIVGFFAVVISRLFYLQVVRGKNYSQFSDQFAIKEIPLKAPRGNILDRKGRKIASTRPSFHLFLYPQKVKNLSVFIPLVAEKLSLSVEEIQAPIDAAKGQARFRPITLKTDLNRDQIARIQMAQSMTHGSIDEMDLNWSALQVKVEPVRQYEGGEMWGHAIGYLREVSEEKLKNLSEQYPGHYQLGDEIGVQGLERRYDLELRGVDGKEEAVVDALGREVREDALGLKKDFMVYPPSPGKNMTLTLDADLQKTAYDALQNKEGAVILIDVKTGEVLAFVSKPSYDPNRLVGNLDRSYWAMLNQDSRRFLLNRASQGTYPPGSTYKIVTGLAALAEGVVKPGDKISCPGYYEVGGRRFGCWSSKGHGPVDFYKALVQSCDVYFYKVGEKLGINKIADYARQMGLGAPTGIDLDFEKSGLIPDTEWKMKTKNEAWNAGETLSASIGQGYNLVTPLQLAVMMARVATQGKEVQPHLLKSWEEVSGKKQEIGSTVSFFDKIDISSLHWQSLFKALWGVVQDPGGTAHRSAIKGFSIGGKTGTAQVVNYDKFGRKAKAKHMEDHAWFVAMAPVEDPEVAISVLVEHGGHGGAAAAPVAQAVLQKYYQLYHSK